MRLQLSSPAVHPYESLTLLVLCLFVSVRSPAAEVDRKNLLRRRERKKEGGCSAAVEVVGSVPSAVVVCVDVVRTSFPTHVIDDVHIASHPLMISTRSECQVLSSPLVRLRMFSFLRCTCFGLIDMQRFHLVWATTTSTTKHATSNATLTSNIV